MIDSHRLKTAWRRDACGTASKIKIRPPLKAWHPTHHDSWSYRIGVWFGGYATSRENQGGPKVSKTPEEVMRSETTLHLALPAGVAQTSVFEVCGSSSDSRFRIQGQTGNRQPAAAHWLRRAHAAIIVHARPLPGSGNLRRLSRRTVTNKTSQAADLKGGGLRYLAFTSSVEGQN